MPRELPELLVPDAPAWRQWLAEHHATAPGVWLVLHKQGGTVTALTYAGALDEALCFGWIAQFVVMLSRHETPYPQKRRPPGS